jgi:hypothetical protein
MFPVLVKSVYPSTQSAQFLSMNKTKKCNDCDITMWKLVSSSFSNTAGCMNDGDKPGVEAQLCIRTVGTPWKDKHAHSNMSTHNYAYAHLEHHGNTCTLTQTHLHSWNTIKTHTRSLKHEHLEREASERGRRG